MNIGDSPLITCSATGLEPINLFWSREDGTVLSRSVTQSKGQLQVYIKTHRGGLDFFKTFETMLHKIENIGHILSRLFY